MAGTKTILVSGATGQQGGAVARSLLKRGYRVKGLTRTQAKAKNLQAMGIEPVQGDLTDKQTLKPTLRGVDGFFIVTTPFGENYSTDTRKEILQGTTAVDAAKAAGIGHVVLTSVASADQDTGIPHFESKAQVERHLAKSGLQYTITRPVAFMDNYTSPWFASSLQAGTLSMPMPAHTKTQLVAVRDIGEIVAQAFDKPRMAAGKTMELAGDELSMADIANRLSRWIARPVRYVEQSEDEVRQRMGEEGLRMFRFLKTKGYHANIASLEKEWEYRMTRLDEYLSTVKSPLLAQSTADIA